MKPDQQRFLFERLKDATPDRYSHGSVEPPAIIVKARRMIAIWERSHAQKKQRAWTKVSRDIRKVRETIYSGDWDKAVAIVKDFERKYAK